MIYIRVEKSRWEINLIVETKYQKIKENLIVRRPENPDDPESAIVPDIAYMPISGLANALEELIKLRVNNDFYSAPLVKALIKKMRDKERAELIAELVRDYSEE